MRRAERDIDSAIDYRLWIEDRNHSIIKADADERRQNTPVGLPTLPSIANPNKQVTYELKKPHATEVAQGLKRFPRLG